MYLHIHCLYLHTQLYKNIILCQRNTEFNFRIYVTHPYTFKRWSFGEEHRISIMSMARVHTHINLCSSWKMLLDNNSCWTIDSSQNCAGIIEGSEPHKEDHGFNFVATKYEHKYQQCWKSEYFLNTCWYLGFTPLLPKAENLNFPTVSSGALKRNKTKTTSG